MRIKGEPANPDFPGKWPLNGVCDCVCVCVCVRAHASREILWQEKHSDVRWPSVCVCVCVCVCMCVLACVRVCLHAYDKLQGVKSFF